MPNGEREIIREILASLSSTPDVTIPPGDDCAAVTLNSSDAQLLLTSDPVISGIHFEPDTEPTLIGNKAAGRVLSDLAAMGALPRWLLFNLAAPTDTPTAHLTAIMQGAQHLARQFNASIVGGDVAESSVLAVNAFACGTIASGAPVSRAGASNGDTIFVTGSLGGSRTGKHLSFTPRVNEGIWLREHSFASSMIDISDGLASDLRHILEASGVGATIETARIPISDSLSALPEKEAISHALCDGEDFELLFTVPVDKGRALQGEWESEFETRLTSIGTITADDRIITATFSDGSTSELDAKGFEHFG